MRVERIILSVNYLGNDIDVNGRMALAANLRIDRSHRPEDIAALSALGNGVIGCLVGYVEGGSPAIVALHLNTDGSIRHDCPHRLGGVSASEERRAPSA